MRQACLVVWMVVGFGCAARSAPRCEAEVWEGQCQLASITKVKDAEFPTPHVVLEAIYRPVPNVSSPNFTPGALAKQTWAKAQHELPLYDYLEAHPRVPCRTQAAVNTACVAPQLVVSLPEFDAEAATRSAAAPPITGCAQIEATSTQDKLQGGQQTQTFIGQRLKFERDSAELPPGADAIAAEVAQLLAQKPSIECLGVVGQISMGERPALAEQRAKAVRDLLAAQGVQAARLLTIGVTAKVFGTGSRPEEGEPDDRRVGFSVLLEQSPKP